MVRPKVEISDDEKAFIISLFEEDKYSKLSGRSLENLFTEQFKKKTSLRTLKRLYSEIVSEKKASIIVKKSDEETKMVKSMSHVSISNADENNNEIEGEISINDQNFMGIEYIIGSDNYALLKEYVLRHHLYYKSLIQQFREKSDLMMFGGTLNEMRGNDMPDGFMFYKPVQTTEDGNCFYNAVSICLYGDESKQQVLRACHIFIIFEYEQFFRTIFNRYQISLEPSFEAFVCKHTNDREWAGELNSLAVAMMINRPINVYSFYNRIMWPLDYPNNRTPLCIGLKHEHFYALMPYDINSQINQNLAYYFNNGPSVDTIHQYQIIYQSYQTTLTQLQSRLKRDISVNDLEIRDESNVKKLKVLPKRKCLTIKEEKLNKKNINQNWRNKNKLIEDDGKDSDIDEREGVSVTAYLNEKEKRRLREEHRKIKSKMYRIGYSDRNDMTDLSNVQPFRLTAFDKVCPHCEALYFQEEVNTRGKFMTCCQDGKIKEEIIKDYHPQMIDLLMPKQGNKKKESLSYNFKKHIRYYNSLLAFASVVTNLTTPSKGAFIYKIQGSIYHQLAPMFVDQSKYKPQAIQFYFLDGDTATKERLDKAKSENVILNKEILESLEKMIKEVNPYYKLFKSYKDILDDYDKKYPGVKFRMYLVRPDDQDPVMQGDFTRNRYTTDIASGTVAGIIEEDQGQIPSTMSVAIYPKSEKMQYIDIRDINNEPMCYPLLFPYGEPGFNKDAEHARQTAKRNRLTLNEHAAFRLCIRNNNLNLLFRSGQLFQQYVVNLFVNIESNNLAYILNNQSNLRVEEYKGLIEHLEKKAEKQNTKTGRMLILPSSFEGGRRCMKKHYHDAMSMVAEFGKPNLFITFTLDPNCEDIKDNLHPKERYIDRPDICARVFWVKLQEFMDDLCKNHIFGVVKAEVSVIEFQKRGLPHSHILLWMNDQDKIKSSEQLDNVIWAFIPDPNIDNDLHKLVVDLMIHTCSYRCKYKDPTKCSKNFPKNFQNITVIQDSGHPFYARPNDGKFYKKGAIIFDNRHVVPYNPYLLKKYRSHINIECVTNVDCVKYLFMYVFKGNDSAIVNIDSTLEKQQESNQFVENQSKNNAKPNENQQDNLNSDELDSNNETDGNEHEVFLEETNDLTINPPIEYDEVKNYVYARYVSPNEASHRVYQYGMRSKSHDVYRLTIHLEDCQSVIYKDNELENAVEKSMDRDTMLTAFFKLNQTDPEANQYTYARLPKFYTFDKQAKIWKKRKRGGNLIIPRILSVTPNLKELYYLRLLLLKIKGPKSFRELKTAKGVTYDTFELAAIARNLVNNGKQWKTLMYNTVNREYPKDCRFLFAMLMLHSNVTNPTPLELWDIFKVKLADDFIKLHNDDEDTAVDKALQHIQHILEINNSSLVLFRLPLPHCKNGKWNDKNEKYLKSNDVYLTESKKMQSSFNEDQKHAFNEIMTLVRSREKYTPKSIYIKGFGGSGKTFLFSTLINECKGLGRSVLAVAYCGIAACILDGGQTVHSRFKLPLNCDDSSTSSMKLQSASADEIRKSDLIIWDEVSMCSTYIVNTVDRLLQDLMNNKIAFGGKCVVFAGDFRQCLPILSEFIAPENISTFLLHKSNIWSHTRHISLNKNMRVLPSEIEFSKWLEKLGDGNLLTLKNTDLIELPSQIVIPEHSKMRVEIYGDGTITKQFIRDSNVAILCIDNNDCFQINSECLNYMEGDEVFEFTSSDSIKMQNPDADEIPMENVYAERPSGFPTHELKLKKGCIIMLLRNLCILYGLCNGTRMIVEECYEDSIYATIFSGQHKGETYLIPKTQFDYNGNKLSYQLTRVQLPIRLAFAITINKSQGQTLDKVGLWLSRPVFSHGQLYVACSRVRSFDNIKIQVVQCQRGEQQQGVIDGKTYTRNIVYKGILKNYI